MRFELLLSSGALLMCGSSSMWQHLQGQFPLSTFASVPPCSPSPSSTLPQPPPCLSPGLCHVPILLKV